jgi:hypothetical protein
MTTPTLGCNDECGNVVSDEDAALQAGWSRLQITGRWRCGRCAAALIAARNMNGAAGETQDTLPKDSRGALRKETASSIAPPTLRSGI